MQTTVEIMGRDVRVSLSEKARRELAKRATPLYAEMELYFSCLIRLKVRFHDTAQNLNSVPVMDKLNIAFHPVMTAACSVDEQDAAPPLTDFPIQNPDAFVPHWLTIDYQHNQWQGQFGYK